MISLTEEKIKAVWDALIQQYQEPRIEPNEKTRKQLMAEYGLSEQQVISMLKRLTEEGKVSRRAIIHKGHKTYVYSVILAEDK